MNKDDENTREKGKTVLPEWLGDFKDMFAEPEGVVREGRLSHHI